MLLLTIRVHVSNFCAICGTVKCHVSLFREPKGTEESQPRQCDAESHNIAVYVKKARGGHTLYGPKKYEEKLEELLAILRKL